MSFRENLPAVARELNAFGFTVEKVLMSRDPEIEDDEIFFADSTYSVQVGDNYLVLGCWIGNDAMEFHAPVSTVGDLIRQLRALGGQRRIN